MHGYSNEYREMWPMFVASGPAFKKNYHIEENLETVDYYSIMCEILQINCPINDGDFKRAHKMLSSVSTRGKKWLEMNESSPKILSINFHTLLTFLMFIHLLFFNVFV